MLHIPSKNHFPLSFPSSLISFLYYPVARSLTLFSFEIQQNTYPLYSFSHSYCLPHYSIHKIASYSIKKPLSSLISFLYYPVARSLTLFSFQIQQNTYPLYSFSHSYCLLHFSIHKIASYSIKKPLSSLISFLYYPVARSLPLFSFQIQQNTHPLYSLSSFYCLLHYSLSKIAFSFRQNTSFLSHFLPLLPCSTLSTLVLLPNTTKHSSIVLYFTLLLPSTLLYSQNCFIFHQKPTFLSHFLPLLPCSTLSTLVLLRNPTKHLSIVLFFTLLLPSTLLYSQNCFIFRQKPTFLSHFLPSKTLGTLITLLSTHLYASFTPFVY